MKTIAIFWVELDKTWIRLSQDGNNKIIVEKAETDSNFVNLSRCWVPCLSQDTSLCIFRADYEMVEDELVNDKNKNFYILRNGTLYKASSIKSQLTNNYFIQQLTCESTTTLKINSIHQDISTELDNYDENHLLTEPQNLPKTPEQFEVIQKHWRNNFELNTIYHDNNELIAVSGIISE